MILGLIFNTRFFDVCLLAVIGTRYFQAVELEDLDLEDSSQLLEAQRLHPGRAPQRLPGGVSSLCPREALRVRQAAGLSTALQAQGRRPMKCLRLAFTCVPGE